MTTAVNGHRNTPSDEIAGPRLHSVPVARRRLNLGLTRFYELIAAGEIRTVKIGHRRLVSEQAICDYIAKLEGQ